MNRNETLRWEPELQILLLCARLRLSEGEQARLRLMLASPFNQTRLLALATHHRLIPLLYRHIKAVNSHELLPEFNAKLASAHKQTTITSLKQIATLCQLAVHLDSAGIPMMGIKGALAAQKLYDDPMLRQARDVDILVPRQQLVATLKALGELGYRAQVPFNHLDLTSKVGSHILERQSEIQLTTGSNPDLLVELHWCLRHEFCREGSDIEATWQKTERLNFYGAPIYTLSSAWLILYLCYHGSRHFFGRLHWLCDVSILAANSSAWEEAEVIARHAGVTTCLGFSVLLAQRLLDSPLPRLSAETLRRGKPLVNKAIKNIKQPIPKIVKGGPEGWELMYQLHERSLHALQLVLYNFFTPTAPDMALIGYRDHVRWLAYGLRPFHGMIRYTLEHIRIN